MSLWGDVKYRVKRSLLYAFGPADLDEEHDPKARLDREHQAKQQQTDPEAGKDWDRG